MKKFKEFLSREIEEYLRRVDFDTDNVKYTLRNITEDENFNDRLDMVIDKILDNINDQIHLVVDDIVDQIDCDTLADSIAKEVESKIFTFKTSIQLLDSVCDKCYRSYGEWISASSGSLAEQEVSKPGTRILFADDF